MCATPIDVGQSHSDCMFFAFGFSLVYTSNPVVSSKWSDQSYLKNKECGAVTYMRTADQPCAKAVVMMIYAAAA